MKYWPSLSIIYAHDERNVETFVYLREEKKRFWKAFPKACIMKVTQSVKKATLTLSAGPSCFHVCHTIPTVRQLETSFSLWYIILHTFFIIHKTSLLHTSFESYKKNFTINHCVVYWKRNWKKKNTFTNLVFLIQQFFLLYNRVNVVYFSSLSFLFLLAGYKKMMKCKLSTTTKTTSTLTLTRQSTQRDSFASSLHLNFSIRRCCSRCIKSCNVSKHLLLNIAQIHRVCFISNKRTSERARASNSIFVFFRKHHQRHKYIYALRHS